MKGNMAKTFAENSYFQSQACSQSTFTTLRNEDQPEMNEFWRWESTHPKIKAALLHNFKGTIYSVIWALLRVNYFICLKPKRDIKFL